MHCVSLLNSFASKGKGWFFIWVLGFKQELKNASLFSRVDPVKYWTIPSSLYSLYFYLNSIGMEKVFLMTMGLVKKGF